MFRKILIPNFTAVSIFTDQWRRKRTEQAPPWKQDSILGWTVDFELYAPYMERTNQLENQTPPMEEPQGSYLDSLSPKRIPLLSV